MPPQANRAAAVFYDQSEERAVVDWGGDELFTRMPRPRAVDTAPPPRYTTVERHRRRPRGLGCGAARPPPPADPAAERRLVLVEPHPVPPEPAATPDAAVQSIPAGWAPVERTASGRRTTVITGHPEDRHAPRPRPRPVASRPRRRRSPAEWVGPRPERIVAWAFVLGLLLILIAISTADAAAL